MREPFRFPVQCVCRPQDRRSGLHDFRGFMGRVESGEVAVGDEVTVLPSGRATRVKDIQLYDALAASAPSPSSR